MVMAAARRLGWRRRSLSLAGWDGIGHSGPVHGTSVAATKRLSQTHPNQVTHVPTYHIPGFWPLLRKLFSVAAAVDVQPLGVDDAVDVERLRAFASRVAEILHRRDGPVRVVVVLVRACVEDTLFFSF